MKKPLLVTLLAVATTFAVPVSADAAPFFRVRKKAVVVAVPPVRAVVPAPRVVVAPRAVAVRRPVVTCHRHGPALFVRR